MNTREYLDAAKVRHNIESDYRLAKMLGVTTGSISGYRKGRTIMENTTAAKIAELLAVSPLQVIADLEMERAKKPEVVKFWARYAAAIMLGAVAAAGGALPQPAQAAGTLHNPNYDQARSDIYIMRLKGRRRRQSALAAMADFLGIGTGRPFA